MDEEIKSIISEIERFKTIIKVNTELILSNLSYLENKLVSNGETDNPTLPKTIYLDKINSEKEIEEMLNMIFYPGDTIFIKKKDTDDQVCFVYVGNIEYTKIFVSKYPLLYIDRRDDEKLKQTLINEVDSFDDKINNILVENILDSKSYLSIGLIPIWFVQEYKDFILKNTEWFSSTVINNKIAISSDNVWLNNKHRNSGDCFALNTSGSIFITKSDKLYPAPVYLCVK